MKNKINGLSYFDIAKMPIDQLYQILSSSSMGHSEEVAREYLEKHGHNEIDFGEEKPLWKKVFEAYFTPFTGVLILLAIISFITDYVIAAPGEKEFYTAVIILVLIFLSGTMTLVQNIRSDKSAQALESIVEVTSAVKRDGVFSEIRTEEIVLGDLVQLKVGDMIPADMRLVETTDLFVSQASLTGESYPVEKKADALVTDLTNDTAYENLTFTGSEVVSGYGVGIVIRTGNDTLFGGVADELSQEAPKTSFDLGIEETSKLLIAFMAIMAPIVVIINVITKGDWLQSILFGISIAVGLTPEMLPMITTTNLVKGAQDMAKEGTIVRNLSSIQNFGAIDVLVTDKTGTLTQDNIVLQQHLGIDGKASERVLRHAYLNSYYQTGLGNLMDEAIVSAGQEELDTNSIHNRYEKVDEVPFDFERRRLSVVVEDTNGKTQMVTKGAIEEVISVCDYYDIDGQVYELDQVTRQRVLADVTQLNSQGLRVLGVAQKSNPSPVDKFSIADECEMVLIGLLAFLDPPKESTARAIQALHDHGVEVKIMSGDNEAVNINVAKQVGLPTDKVISGEEIQTKSEEELVEIVKEYNLFVKLNPTQKSQLVSLLRENGHVVGFLGDGINDAPALREADVGISVDNAVDIARESADIILLEKDLMVLEKGIVSGRRIFGNTMKYIKTTTSSNFGNVFSVLLASLFLPFLPMKPVQLLVLGLISDISSMSIPWDNMDEEYLKTPKVWDASTIKSFMFWFGPTSSIFDAIAFWALYKYIAPAVAGGAFHTLGAAGQEHFIAVFQTGWFIVSLWTQVLVIFTLRTPKMPFIQSNPSFITATCMSVGLIIGSIIPYTKLGLALDLAPLPKEFWWLMLVIVAGYLVLVQIIKNIYVKRYGELL